MATGQVALARHRTPTITMQKARSQVPAFLQKLHEMVNDPNNHELIRWSDAGDSFFVLDHERFAREVLGRWFKHQNFASFVRQLNMYGFHKIPHLQQGVLKSDTDTEFWNFAHPNFVRGQPDLLCLIQRKKQVAQGAAGADGLVDGVLDLQRAEAPSNGSTANGATSGANGNTSSPNANNQVLDVSTIVNGITAIKRHQAAISQELNELKQSNQLLWQDAMDARQKHQKQQDTINRILKFLAGVFGNRAGGGMGHHKDVDGSGNGMNSGAMVPRRVSRFLIEDGRSGQNNGKVRIEDDDEDMDDDQMHFSIPEYPIVETPYSVPSPAQSDASVPSSITQQPTPTAESVPQREPLPVNTPGNPYLPTTPAQSFAPSAVSSSSNPVTKPKETNTTASRPSQPQPATAQQQSQSDVTDRSITPTRSPPHNLDFDPRVQTFLNQLTPTQIQQLLLNLNASDSLTTDHTQAGPGSGTSQQVMPYSQPLDWGQFISNTPSIQNVPGGVDSLLSFDDHPPTGEDLTHYTNDAQAQRIARDWKAAEDIDRDVNAMSTDIESFIRDLGLDPSTIEHAGGGLGEIGGEDGMSDDGHGNMMDTAHPSTSQQAQTQHKSTASGSSTGTGAHIPAVSATGAGVGNAQDPGNLFDIGSLLWDQLDPSNPAVAGLSGYAPTAANAEAFANSGLDPVQRQASTTAAGTHSRNSSAASGGLQPPVAGYEGNKRKSLDLSDRESVSGMSTLGGGATGNVQESPTTKGTKRRRKAN